MSSPRRFRIAVITTFAQNREPSFLPRYHEFVVRQSACQILRRVKARKVLADDLVGFVSLETLGAGVPGEDESVRIQHENRIVSDGFDEEPETLLAFLQTWIAVSLAVHAATTLARREPAKRPVPA